MGAYQEKTTVPSYREFFKKGKIFWTDHSAKYKGKGFSPFAHAKLIEKLAGHNIPLSIITMVPNSLGPAELLLNTAPLNKKQIPSPFGFRWRVTLFWLDRGSGRQ